MSKKRTHDLKEACLLVEIACRELGPDCQVIFSNDGVEIAPLGWGGSSTGKDLYEALEDAKK